MASSSVNQKLVDALVRHQVYLSGYSRDVAQKLGETLNATAPAMRSFLLEATASNDTDTQTMRRLKQIEAKLIELRTPGWTAAKEQFVGTLTDLLQYEPEFLATAVARLSADIHVLRNRPELGVLQNLIKKANLIVGRNLDEVWKALTSSDLARVIGAARIGYVAREAGRAIAARVVGTIKQLSPVLNAGLTALDTVVSTAITAFANAARELSASLNPEVFAGSEIWVSILDNATTIGCVELDGKIFKADEGIRPGYHYGCRSDRVPFLVDEPAPTKPAKFADWLDTQGSKFKKFIGKMKAFTKKGIPPLTLDDVKKLDAETMKDE